jgi:CubicO group peptidase (beta-lactamase class C family)
MLDRRSLILAGASAFAHIGPTVVVPTVSQALKNVLDAAEVPALGYVLVGPKGVIKLEVAGRRRSDAAAAVAPDDIWHMGSNTEAMTAVVYGRLVEKGLAVWRADVGLLFPDIKIDPSWGDVTIEEFLSHRAGVSDVGLIDEGWLIRTAHDKRPLPDQRTALVSRILGRPAAGRRHDYEYSNSDYVVVGAAIERLTQTSWEEAITAELFQPLALSSAGFGAPTGDEPWGHEVSDGGELAPVDPSKGVADNPAVLAPGGQVHMSLPDYAGFVQLFLDNGGGFLKPDTLMHLARPEDALAEGDGMGWRVSPLRSWARGPVLAHEGSNTLWRVLAEVAPARPLGVVVVTNAGGEPGARAVQMMSSRLISDQTDSD